MSGVDLSGLNERQRGIVTTLDEPLFVEAGAGSGKTFTLTQRIAWALSPGSGEGGRPYLDDLSQALVITFTNAAAREIRERVRSTLRAAGLREQALQVDSAWISTIHGMCSRIIRRHALELGVDPRFQVVSGNEQAAFDRQALEEVVGEAYRQARPGSALREALDEYQLGGEGPQGWYGTLGVVQSIRAAAASVAGGYEALDFPEADDVAEAMGRLELDVGALAAQRLSAAARERVVACLGKLEDFGGLAPGRRTAEAALEALGEMRLPARVGKAAEAELREAKRSLVEARSAALLARARRWVPDLVGLARQTDARVRQLERASSVISNDGLIDLALEAVTSHEGIARDYAGRFRLVMVDEFQDTDERQLKLIGILAGGDARHLTTVGDAQQSIYRFRGADVGVFRSRGRDLAQGQHRRLDVNYRSHADVLSFVDAVCGGPGGVLADFMHLDANPGRADGYRARDLPRIDLELTLGSGMRGRVGAEQAAVGAAAIADRLAEYVAHGERPGRMALLLGTTTRAATYIDAIRARGLDCVVTGGSTFTSAPEVATVAKLLHALANPHDTQSGLFPLLTSEMFELDANDLVQLGTRAQEVHDAPTNRRIDRGLETMEFFHDAPQSARLVRAHEVLARGWAALATRPVADVCLQVVRDSGWLERLEGEGPQGVAREANVLAAVRHIRDLTERMGLGAARAATEFDTWLSVSKVPPASLAGGEMSSVRVMTIHASKGLEFPVTAVAECWNRRADAGKLVSLSRAGRRTCVLVPADAPKGLDDLGPVEGEGPGGLVEWYRAIREESRAADDEERTRLLYVALTRAREALIVGCNLSSTKSGMGPDLACALVRALLPQGLPEVGESRFDYGGSEPGRLRLIEVERTPEGSSAASAGTLASLDGPLPEDPSQIVAAGTGEAGQGQAERTFALFEIEDDPCAATTRGWSARKDVFSYSSAHERMAAQAPPGEGGASPARDGRPAPPRRAEREATDEGAPMTSDADRATSLGSAFHELAQGMVETGRYPSAGRVDASARCWGLSGRARARLEAALGRWWGSELRREVLRHDRVRAEVPFFSPVAGTALERHGRYVEGAIDLLATDEGSGHALLVDYKTGDQGLSGEEIRARHEMQAGFYASVLMAQGFTSVECRFVCVEVEDDAVPGEPFVVSYGFDAPPSPRI